MTVAQSEPRDLTADENDRRTQLEAVVDRGLDTFVDVGQALRELGEWRLYKSTHSTFAEYVKERFGLATSQAYRLIEAAKVSGGLSPVGDNVVGIRNERQARELVGLAPEVAQEVVTSVLAATGGKPTAAALREAREQLVDKTTGEINPPSRPPAPPPTPQPEADLTPEQKAEQARQAEHEEERRRQRVETHLLCEHVVVLAQARGLELGHYYTREDVIPGRAVTRQVIADAIAALEDLAIVWKERDLP